MCMNLKYSALTKCKEQNTEQTQKTPVLPVDPLPKGNH